MPTSTMINQHSATKPVYTKRMKHLFLIFLKQFQVNEYKQLIQFLQLIIDKYNLNPSKLFGFLTTEEEAILNDLSVQKPLQYNQTINKKNNNNNNNTSEFRRSLRLNSAKLASSFNKHKRIQVINNINKSEFIKPKLEPIELNDENVSKPATEIKSLQFTNESTAMMEILANRSDIIDSFVMKDNEDYAEETNEDQWETFIETTNQNYGSDESATDLPTQDSASNNNGNKSRIRKFSTNIRNELERSFLSNNFITGSEKQILAKRLNLTERQVSKWFVHRREKLRRLEKRATNINSTLQQHYRTQQLNQTAPESNYNESTYNDEFYEDNEEENWFNGLQAEGEDEPSDVNQFVTHDETDYFDDAENTNGYHSSTETNNSDDNQYETRIKHVSTDQLNSSAKRPCIQSNIKPSRRLFPPEVVTHLETIFDSEKYVKDERVSEISHATNLSEKQIRSWFKQRRYRYNQENKLNGIDIEIKKYNNLSQQVVNELEKAFRKNNFVFGNEKKILARKLNLTPVQIERWFYYRRKKQSNGPAINTTF